MRSSGEAGFSRLSRPAVELVMVAADTVDCKTGTAAQQRASAPGITPASRAPPQRTTHKQRQPPPPFTRPRRSLALPTTDQTEMSRPPMAGVSTRPPVSCSIRWTMPGSAAEPPVTTTAFNNACIVLVAPQQEHGDVRGDVSLSVLGLDAPWKERSFELGTLDGACRSTYRASAAVEVRYSRFNHFQNAWVRPRMIPAVKAACE